MLSENISEGLGEPKSGFTSYTLLEKRRPNASTKLHPQPSPILYFHPVREGASLATLHLLALPGPFVFHSFIAHFILAPSKSPSWDSIRQGTFQIPSLEGSLGAERDLMALVP